jgi:DNA repair exonuclease SbcCD ATPase subunit
MEHPAEHLEHIEHHQHAAHSPFERRVAMTMAIAAAVLACVTMLSHRAHNDTLNYKNDALREQQQDYGEALRLQSEVNQLQTQADIQHTQASDQWNYYQAKKNRQYLYEALAEMLPLLGKDRAHADAAAASEQLVASWKKKAGEYRQDTAKIEEEARRLEQEGQRLLAESRQKQQQVQRLQEKLAKYQEAAPGAEEHLTALAQSHAAHERGNRFDLAELALQLALILCSVAILTKRPAYWYAGIAAGVLGGLVALSVLLLH